MIAQQGSSCFASTGYQQAARQAKQTSTLVSDVQAAKDIEASRLQFSGRPAFDPVPLLDPDAASWYMPNP